MYIIICPLAKLVLSRIIKVKGRIIWEKISTRGKNSIKATGDPYGSIWDIKPLKLVVNTHTIIGIQNNKEMVTVWE